MPRYQFGLHSLPDGSTVSLPGDENFVMPHALPSEIDIFDIDTASVQRYPVGTRLLRGENVFRYVEFGGTTVAGDLLQAEAPDGAHDDLDPTGSGTGAGVAAGSKIISIATSVTLVVNEYALGKLVIETDTGAGYDYDIVANEVAAGAANANVTIRDGLAVAIDATSDVKLIKSRFKEVIKMPATVTGMLVGASKGIGADGSFGWVTTRGPAAMLTDGTVTIGEHVRTSDGTPGTVEALDRDGTNENEAEVGYVIEVAATGQYSLIFLTLE